MSERVNVLLIGGGGREHALATFLAQSPRLGQLWTSSPENPGIAALAQPVDCPVTAREAYRAVQFCEKHRVGLVVIGPEEPLAQGLADKLAAPDRLVFGPTAAGARLEADKAWSKQLMRMAPVPTAEGRSFSEFSAAHAYVRSREQPPVIKASGLAKGKGVIVPSSIDEALAGLERIMRERVFGDAGSTVVVEERLDGHEVSVLALVDGRTLFILEPAQDYKRLADGDAGPNTGGMGAICPSRAIDDAMMDRVQREILVPTIDALRREGVDFRGVLYAGIMLTHAGPKVLEFNVRFGDPECQAILPRLDADLVEVLSAVCTGTLDRVDIGWKPIETCCVVLASDGYPDSPRTGVPIRGIDDARRSPGVHVFHAGTRASGDRIVTAGGRVLNVVGAAPTLAAARAAAYDACATIHFDGMRFRKDIGAG